MNIAIFQVDAFTDTPFCGNPAAVCPLPEWPSEQWMQNVAMENNLSETAFFVGTSDGYYIRWFTPQCEIELCGHATLASAFILWQYLEEQSPEITFHCASGALSVTREGDLLQLDLPARPIRESQSLSSDAISALTAALGAAPSWIGLDNGRCLVELESEQELVQLAPDMKALVALPYKTFLVTATSNDYDFVCRVFAPSKGIDEDPVTGSAFTALTPYWSHKLGKAHLYARQVSKRGGNVRTQLRDERVLIAGNAVCVLRGELLLPLTR